MSCPPLCQPIRFLAACTLDRVCFFSVSYLVFCRGDGAFAPFPRFFSLCVLVSVWST